MIHRGWPVVTTPVHPPAWTAAKNLARGTGGEAGDKRTMVTACRGIRAEGRDVQSVSVMGRAVNGFRHEVAFYEGMGDLVRAVVPFVREGVARREPVLVAMAPARLDVVERALGADAVRVDFVDMTELGANPACIIPEWRRFLEDTADQGAARGVGEPVWPGRRDVELCETDLHEALLNLAFDGGPTWRLLCPYDVSALPRQVVSDARRNHPVVHAAADGAPSDYAGHDSARRTFASALPPVPSDALVHRFAGIDISGVRRLVRVVALEQGLEPRRVDDLMLAAHELATNSVTHGGGRGEVAIWREPGALAVEIHDQGWIEDPLVGQGLLDLQAEAGRGIWMANQLCDLVQVRSGDRGTQVRLWSWL
jgi:anti-sigma regulatory factor (Ser/Thr protein kinase)